MTEVGTKRDETGVIVVTERLIGAVTGAAEVEGPGTGGKIEVKPAGGRWFAGRR